MRWSAARSASRSKSGHDPRDRPQVVDERADVEEPDGRVRRFCARDVESGGLELCDGERQVEVGTGGDRAAERAQEVVVTVSTLLRQVRATRAARRERPRSGQYEEWRLSTRSNVPSRNGRWLPVSAGPCPPGRRCRARTRPRRAERPPPEGLAGDGDVRRVALCRDDGAGERRERGERFSATRVDVECACRAGERVGGERRVAPRRLRVGASLEEPREIPTPEGGRGCLIDQSIRCHRRFHRPVNEKCM